MMILESIESPEDLKNLSVDSLKILADEIRTLILETVSKTGGHLSSNLGIVELTIALHKVFNSPTDHFLFDTGHQGYTHKILTGRRKDFSSLRQFHGLSGFFSPDESNHDLFFSGHSGTAFSLALGLARARDHRSEETKNHIISILGDGSLTCGHTLEALNNVPKNLEKFILVLNDNKMAIGKNVGHIKNILTRLVNHPQANHFYHRLLQSLSKIPSFGPKLARHGQKLKETVKNLFSHTALFFEQFGLSYVGPIDGHDLKKMIDVFTLLRNETHPVVVHILTTKGKGFDAAIENPTEYHGVSSFDFPKTLNFSKKIPKTTFPQVFGHLIVQLAKEDSSIYALSPAMIQGSQLSKMASEFPDRTLDVGIAEGHCLTYAAGLAKKNNMKVVVSVYSTFLQRAFDQLFHDICLQNIPVIIAIDRAGLNGPDGPSHHGIYDIGFLKSLPNLVVAQARNGQLLEDLIRSSFSYKSPVAIRYPNRTTSAPEKFFTYRPLGKAEILSKGQKILILALGHTVDLALEIQSLLKKDELFPTLVDPIFLKPLDEPLLEHLIETHELVVTLEEHSIISGFGEIINSFAIRKKLLSSQIINFGILDRLIHQGSNEQILKEMGLDAQSIAKEIKKLLSFESTHSLEAYHDHLPLHQ